MRAVLLAVLLYALPAHASYLTIQTECGKPKYVFAVLDGVVMDTTWDSIWADPEAVNFLRAVLADLPVVDGKQVFREVKLERVLGRTCPVPV